MTSLHKISEKSLNIWFWMFHINIHCGMSLHFHAHSKLPPNLRFEDLQIFSFFFFSNSQICFKVVWVDCEASVNSVDIFAELKFSLWMEIFQRIEDTHLKEFYQINGNIHANHWMLSSCFHIHTKVLTFRSQSKVEWKKTEISLRESLSSSMSRITHEQKLTDSF